MSKIVNRRAGSFFRREGEGDDAWVLDQKWGGGVG